MIEYKIDKFCESTLEKLWNVFEYKSYSKISIFFTIISGAITIITGNLYWLILSAPLSVPFLILLFLMSIYFCLLFPYLMTVKYLFEHKIIIGTARLIGILVQVGVLAILYLLRNSYGE